MTVSEVAEVVKGVSYRSADLAEDSSTALVTLKSISRTGQFADRGYKPYVGDFRPKQEVHEGDILVAQTDLTQGAEVVGWAVRVPGSISLRRWSPHWTWRSCGPSRGCPSEFLLGALRDPRFRRHCRSMTSGTTVLHLAKDAIPEYALPVVDGERVAVYADKVRSLHALGDSVSKESSALARTRDTLLRLLMSGRVRVKDAEATVEAVV